MARTKTRQITDEVTERAADLRWQGLSWTEIAERVGGNSSSIRHRVQRRYPSLRQPHCGSPQPPATAHDDATLDAVVRESFLRQWPRPVLATGIVNGIERLHRQGHDLQAIARLLNYHRKPPFSRDTDAWNAVDVRLVLVIAGDPETRALLTAEAEQCAA